MALMDEAVWRGMIYSDGWVGGAGGDAAVIEPATGQEIVTIRGDIAPYPF
jgi:benzaldehyde dehydrogenase (NAD)